MKEDMTSHELYFKKEWYHIATYDNHKGFSDRKCTWLIFCSVQERREEIEYWEKLMDEVKKKMAAADVKKKTHAMNR